MIRRCVVCGREYETPPSSKKITCSKECSSARKRITHTGKHNTWNPEARARLSMAGQTDNLKLGTAAAQKSPIAGRFPTNQEAKIWTLVDPSGEEITVRNLLLWARENTALFGKPDGDHSAKQIAAGFRAISQTLLGTRKTPSMSYFGWTLKCPPETPE